MRVSKELFECNCTTYEFVPYSCPEVSWDLKYMATMELRCLGKKLSSPEGMTHKNHATQT